MLYSTLQLQCLMQPTPTQQQQQHLSSITYVQRSPAISNICASIPVAAGLHGVTVFIAGCQAPAEATSHSANSSTSSVYLTAADAAPQQSSSLLQAANRTTGSNLPCDIRLDPSLAAAFTAAVYDVVKQQGVVSEKQLQMERFKLQNREYKYYAGDNRCWTYDGSCNDEARLRNCVYCVSHSSINALTAVW